MLHHIKRLLGIKPKEVTQPEAAPYKIEAPSEVAKQASEAVVASIPKAKKPRASKVKEVVAQEADKVVEKKPRKPRAKKD